MAPVHRAVRGRTFVKWPEVREVKDPASPAVAFYENGRIVVEVDEKLKGRERSRAIMAAYQAHERGLAAFVPLPALIVVADQVKRWTRDHTTAALATTAAAGGAVTLSLNVLGPMVLDGDTKPHMAQPSPAQSITVTVAPTMPSPSAKSTRTPTPTTSSRSASAPSAVPSPRGRTPTGRPSRTSRPAREPTALPTRSRSTQPTVTKQATAPPVREAQTLADSPSPARTTTPPRAGGATPPGRSTDAAEPPGLSTPPGQAAAGRDCLVELHVPRVVAAGVLC